MKPAAAEPCERCDDSGVIHDDGGPHGWWHCSCRAGKAKESVYRHTVNGAPPVRVRLRSILGMDVVGAFVASSAGAATVDTDACRHSVDWCLVESIEVLE